MANIVRSRFSHVPGAVPQKAPVTRTVVAPKLGASFGSPTISSVAPPLSDLAGKMPISVSGDHLTGVAEVRIGGTPCTDFTVVHAKLITCTSPAKSSGTYDVTLHDASGATLATLAASFVVGALSLYLNPTRPETCWQDVAGVTPAVSKMPVERVDDLSGHQNHIEKAGASILYSNNFFGCLQTTGPQDTLLSKSNVHWAAWTTIAFVANLSPTPQILAPGAALFGAAEDSGAGALVGRYDQMQTEPFIGVADVGFSNVSLKHASAPCLYDSLHHVLAWRYNGTNASATLAIDGANIALTDVASAKPGTLPDDRFAIGEPATGANTEFPYSLGIVVRFDEVLTAAQEAIIRAFVNTSHGV